MRHIGDLTTRKSAELFTAYLITQHIDAVADDESTHWSVWVKDEDAITEARRLYDQFRHDPSNGRYANVIEQAVARRREERQRHSEVQKNVVEMRSQWRSTYTQRTPLVTALFVLCVIVAFLSGMGENSASTPMKTLLFANTYQLQTWSPATVADRAVDIRRGEVWRVITPIFVHYGATHLIMNMIMLFMLGGHIESRRGALVLGLLVLLTGAASNLVQCLMPGEWGGSVHAAGMSGVLYGLLGYAWIKMQLDPSSRLFVPPGMFMMLVGWMLIGFTGVLEQFNMHLANWAHGAGFVAGLALGSLPIRRSRASGKSSA